MVFNQLLVLTNMPIQRFGSTLVSKGTFGDYIALLKANFRQDNLASIMCKTQVSVNWQGYLSDCDFNQQLGLAAPRVQHMANHPHLRDLIDQSLEGQPIRVADHCYGCTAGQGSSCGGALN